MKKLKHPTCFSSSEQSVPVDVSVSDNPLADMQIYLWLAKEAKNKGDHEAAAKHIRASAEILGEQIPEVGNAAPSAKILKVAIATRNLEIFKTALDLLSSCTIGYSDKNSTRQSNKTH